MTYLGSKKPLQLAHFGYEDAKILGTKVWGGSLDFNVCWKKDCNDDPISIFPPCYAFQMIWPLG